MDDDTVTTLRNDSNSNVKPFIKWAGGKKQLLKEIKSAYPEELGTSIKKYAEPFIGGGAVLLDILSTYEIDEAYISDVNRELICTYATVRDDPKSLVSHLSDIQTEYSAMESGSQSEYYYGKRDLFNKLKNDSKPVADAELASLFIFLNRTCFNGLYRVNRSKQFNVPFGKHKNPKICDKDNIKNVSKKMKNVEIVCGDYKESRGFVDASTFVYFDPPYRPLTNTASFASYAESGFNDDDQRELAEYVKTLSRTGAKVLVSNSDPKNTDPADDFFDDLYQGNNITRVYAQRMINSVGDKRGKISELLISNYEFNRLS
jgi:DNA adenine methylase